MIRLGGSKLPQTLVLATPADKNSASDFSNLDASVPMERSLGFLCSLVHDSSVGHESFCEQVAANKPSDCTGSQDQMRMNHLRHPAPAVSEEISDGKERDNPDEGSKIAKQDERGQFQSRYSGDDCGKVPDSRHEVSEHQSPVSEPREPIMYSLYPLLSGPKEAPIAGNNSLSQQSAKEVADRDARGAS